MAGWKGKSKPAFKFHDLHGNICGLRWRFSLKPIHWYSICRSHGAVSLRRWSVVRGCCPWTGPLASASTVNWNWWLYLVMVPWWWQTVLRIYSCHCESSDFLHTISDQKVVVFFESNSGHLVDQIRYCYIHLTVESLVTQLLQIYVPSLESSFCSHSSW